MKTKIINIILIYLLSLPTAATAGEIIDQAGRTVQVPDKISRLISLAPSITEIVYALEQGEKLVGATQYSTHPAAAQKLPRVGSYVRLDLEKIISLKPNLCLGIKDGNPEHTVSKLEELGIPVYVIDPRNLDDIVEVTKRLGKLLGAEETSNILVAEMLSRMTAIRQKIALTDTKPAVFFQIDAAPIITVGRDTFIHELITLAGGRNVAGGPDPYPRYNWEDILKLQPEIVIVASMAGGHTPEELKSGWLKWPQIPAVKNKRLYVVDADLIDRPTPHLLDGLEEFARIIHPEIFGEPDAK
ncbi:MAG: cobalamin-binding protein [Proteobacteria bacterium]|nr:cobalamin-binding protein [Pseudomonadota bacterium]MBU1715263.1 cobalamin-binding protein [Pseudomonadota bacterium]